MAAAAWLAACGPDEAERLPSNAAYVLGIQSARIAATNDGVAWDPDDGTPPDPFVVFTYGPDWLNESIGCLTDTWTPTWTGTNGYRSVLVTVGELRTGLLAVQLWDLDPVTSTNETWSGNDPITSPRAIALTDDQIRAGILSFTSWDRAESATFFVSPAE